MFSHPELRRYRTSICSGASLILLFTLGLTFIPPLLVVYRSHGKLLDKCNIYDMFDENVSSLETEIEFIDSSVK